MNIIFLDFDGVLTTPESNYTFVPSLLERLGRILDETKAKIVITSSWRSSSVTDMISTLKNKSNPVNQVTMFPYTERVIGVTPRCGAWYRGQELDRWMKMNENMNYSYIILDDEDNFTPEQRKHLIQTNHSTGLSEEDTYKAISFFNNQ